MKSEVMESFRVQMAWLSEVRMDRKDTQFVAQQLMACAFTLLERDSGKEYLADIMDAVARDIRAKLTPHTLQ